jgi:hypothetical protein
VPGVSIHVYRTVLRQLRENSRRRTIKLTFNATLDELNENLPAFAKMGFDGAILARTPPEELTKTIRKLGKIHGKSHRPMSNKRQRIQ